MLKADRQAAIVRLLRTDGSVKTDALADRLGVSAITVRRDLAELEAAGIASRAYGGATLVENSDTPPLDPVHDSQGRPLRVAMIVPGSQYYFAPMIAGAVDFAKRRGIRGILSVSYYSPEEEVKIFRRMLAIGVDAVVLTPSESDVESSPVGRILHEANCPVVLLERGFVHPALHQAIDSVRTNHEAGAELAIRHLAQRGRRNIASLFFKNATMPHLNSGYAEALRELGMATPQVEIKATDDEMHEWALNPRHPRTTQFLNAALDQGVDALVVNPDQHAVALTGLALQMGLRVPEDLAIVAYDDEVAALSEVPLTAVAPPKRELGRIAFELCVQRVLEEVQSRTPTQHVALIPELRVRDST